MAGELAFQRLVRGAMAALLAVHDYLELCFTDIEVITGPQSGLVGGPELKRDGVAGLGPFPDPHPDAIHPNLEVLARDKLIPWDRKLGTVFRLTANHHRVLSQIDFRALPRITAS